MKKKTKEERLRETELALAAIKPQGGAHVNVSHTLSHKLKRALNMPNGGFAQKNPKALEQARSTMFKQMMKSGYVARKSKHAVPTKKLALALGEHACGESQRDIEKRYALSNGTINAVLQRIFPSREAMEDCMENLLLSNALLCGQRVADLAPEMKPNEATIATGIMAQRYLEVRKARSNNFATDVPVGVIIRLEQTMEKIKQVHGKVIDVDTEPLAIEDKEK